MGQEYRNVRWSSIFVSLPFITFLLLKHPLSLRCWFPISQVEGFVLVITMVFWKVQFCLLYKEVFPEWPKIGEGRWLELKHRAVPCHAGSLWMAYWSKDYTHTFWIPVQFFNIKQFIFFHLVSQNSYELTHWFFFLCISVSFKEWRGQGRGTENNRWVRGRISY